MDEIIIAEPRRISLRGVFLVALVGIGMTITPLWFAFVAWCGWLLAKWLVVLTLS